MSSLYAIGDIHGCITALKTLFAQGVIQKDDRVIFLGDYTDRGPDSKGVLDWLIENSRHYQFEFILGNHDLMMQSARTDRQELLWWLQFGGDATLDSYAVDNELNWHEKVPSSHWTFIDQCKPFLEIDDYIFVHAGLMPGVALADQHDHDLYWRKYEEPEMYVPDKQVICGHTSRKNGKVHDFGHTICIDTYAYGGQWLTCLNVESGEYLQANEEGVVQKGDLGWW